MVQSLISDISREFRSMSSKYKEDIQLDSAIIAFRNWGNWVYPDGEEDYDWAKLSQNSYDELTQFIQLLLKRYQQFNIEFDIDEKNWISIYISKKEFCETI
jgi:hypothetical protein